MKLESTVVVCTYYLFQLMRKSLKFTLGIYWLLSEGLVLN
jgi:hypothetical protein